LFLKPVVSHSEEAGIPVPKIDRNKCSGCGECARSCMYNALAVVKTAMLFPELCHGCGGCALACPAGAIVEEARAIGVVEQGRAGEIDFVQGRLNVGEPMSPPLIRAVKRSKTGAQLHILDAPPGTSCPVVATVRDADYVILVTEPTPFGLCDLKLAVELMGELNLRFGVLINRVGMGDERVRFFCEANGIDILAEVPDDRRVAEAYSRGESPLSVREFQEAVSALASRVLEKAGA
jgi:MinD superfamily P-loop ATPase